MTTLSMTDLAINASLEEMSTSLSADLRMLRNYRAELVKMQRFERVELLKDVEHKLEVLMLAAKAAKKINT